MSTRYLGWVAAVALTLSACGGGEQQQEAATPEAAAPAAAPAAAVPAGELPAGVTQAMVDEGKTLFHGAGICYTCHGQNGVGVAGLGPSLGDAEWLHGDGSYEGIVAQITKGVAAAESKSGIMMPPKGGSAITDEQVKAVAGYVWSLRKG
jgi:mono/diheme cytochrome c family protein